MMDARSIIANQLPAGVREGLEVCVERDLYNMHALLHFRKPDRPATVVTHQIKEPLGLDDESMWKLPDEVIAHICAVL